MSPLNFGGPCLVSGGGETVRRATSEESGIGNQTDALLRRVRSLDTWLVTDALATLSAEHREVVVGAYYGGKPVAVLAEELGIAPGTVKSRMHYGIRALRLALQERGVTA